MRRIGRLVLNRNPDNFFSEQVAYCTSHLVPGIEASNDPLFQGRQFSYFDTQLTRLGGPNFEELPINRPVCPVTNNQRDVFMRAKINRGQVNCPALADPSRAHTRATRGPRPQAARPRPQVRRALPPGPNLLQLAIGLGEGAPPRRAVVRAGQGRRRGRARAHGGRLQPHRL